MKELRIIQPEKTSNISQQRHRFRYKMKSKKWAQKFHTNDVSLSRSGYSASDWTKQISNQSEALPTSGSDTSSVWNFHAHFSDIFLQENSGGLAKCLLFSQAKDHLAVKPWFLKVISQHNEDIMRMKSAKGQKVFLAANMGTDGPL